MPSAQRPEAPISDFERALKSATNPGTECIRYALAWIAHADGTFGPAERELLEKFYPQVDQDIPLEVVLASIRAGSLRDARAALGYLRMLEFTGRMQVLEMMVMMVLSDERLSIGEIHALRFCADVMGCAPHLLDAAYRKMAGRELIEPGDPSSPAWWRATQQRTSNAGGQSRSENREQDSRSTPPPRSARPGLVAHLAVLGLVEPVTASEVKQAYRRLAAVHHPDRFEKLGGEAAERAKRTFQRIQEAYESALKELA